MKKVRLTNPVLLLYLLVTYLLPALVNWLTGYESEIYLNPSNGIFSWLYATILFVIVGVFAFDFKHSGAAFRPAAEPPAWNLPVRALLVILLIVLSVAVAGSTLGLSRWRYSGEGLSSSLDATTLLYVLAPSLIEMLMFVLIFFRYNARLASVRMILLLAVACLALTATGIGPMISVLLAAVAFLAPDTLRRWVFRADGAARRRILTSVTLRKLAFAAITVILGMGAYVIGDAIKRDMDPVDVIRDWGESGETVFIDYLIGRLSVHWYSLVVAIHQFVDLDVGGQFYNLMAPVCNAWYRISVLMGGWAPVDRPLNGSLGRLNYLLINRYPLSDREGSSPGLIASFLIAFPTWLAPFALTAYLSLYNKIQERVRQRMAGRLTWMGEALLLHFTSIFFDSPVDFLLIFDPMLFTVVCWVALGYGLKSSRWKIRAWRPSVSRG